MLFLFFPKNMLITKSNTMHISENFEGYYKLDQTAGTITAAVAATKFSIGLNSSNAPTSNCSVFNSTLPALQARVGSDYRPGNDQFKIGITAMFVDALNLAPSKDTFWSTGNQPGNPYRK